MLEKDVEVSHSPRALVLFCVILFLFFVFFMKFFFRGFGLSVTSEG
jgi:hypothetical protein